VALENSAGVAEATAALKPATGGENGKTLVLGLEHFIDKIGYQAVEYRRRGIDVLYLVLDRSGLSRVKAEQFAARVHVVPESLFARVLFTIGVFRRERPAFCELYDIGRLTLLYALIARAAGAKLTLILRGTELWTGKKTRLRLAGTRLTLRLCHHIVAKELNIVRDLKALGVKEDRVTFIGNCVPFPEEEPRPMQAREIDLLFLNSVKRWRNVDLLVRAIPAVLREFPTARVVIAGFTHLDGTAYRIDEEAERDVLALIRTMGLQDRIEVAGFVSDAASYYRNAKVFVLPADIIFANYSLLEAMSYGVVPVVGDGEGAELIVKSGENGLVVERSTEALAAALVSLLKDDSTLEQFAVAARRTIAREFSIHAWGESMLKVRRLLCRV